MSCSSCKGCGSGPEELSNDDDIEVLILRAITDHHVSLSEDDSASWDDHFNQIAFLMTNGQITALKPMAAVYEQRGPREFTRVVTHLFSMNMRGLLIFWAWNHVAEDLDEFIRRILSSDHELIAFVNHEADVYECFPGHTKQPRARAVPSSAESSSTPMVLRALRRKERLRRQQDDASNMSATASVSVSATSPAVSGSVPDEGNSNLRQRNSTSAAGSLDNNIPKLQVSDIQLPSDADTVFTSTSSLSRESPSASSSDSIRFSIGSWRFSLNKRSACLLGVLGSVLLIRHGLRWWRQSSPVQQQSVHNEVSHEKYMRAPYA